MFWSLAALMAAAALLLLAQDQETLNVESPVSAGDARFVEYVASLVGAAVESGDEYLVLRNGDEVFPAMLDAIRRAERRIIFESFIYEEGVVGNQFTAELVAAARRGVTVRIVLDAFGANLTRASVDSLTSAGVEVRWFNPITLWSLEEANYRTHRKVLVVDGRIGFTGGIGLADHWRGNAEDADRWRDTQFRVTGPGVRALEAAFYENWIESGGRSAPALDPEQPGHGTRVRWCCGAIPPAVRATSNCSTCCRSLQPGSASTFSRPTSSWTSRAAGRSRKHASAGSDPDCHRW